MKKYGSTKSVVYQDWFFFQLDVYSKDSCTYRTRSGRMAVITHVHVHRPTVDSTLADKSKFPIISEKNTYT